MNRIQLLLADDHDIVRAGLKSLLEKQEAMEVVGEATGGEEAVSLANELKPDVVLMDITMPDLDGIQATRRIKETTPAVNVLALSIHEEEAYFFEMLKAGASGYVPKRASPQLLLTAIEVVARGDIFLHPTVAGTLVQDCLRGDDCEAERAAYDGLTRRQREVLTLIAEGLSNEAIGERLAISKKTVERHRENIMKQLHLHNRAELVKYALRKGLIRLDEG